MYDDDEYEYDDHRYNTRPYRESREEGVKVTNVEETVMIINSPYLINTLKAVVEYYPGSTYLPSTEFSRALVTNCGQ